MLESKIWEEAEQKSKIFLRQVMGSETFEKFIKEGKIEIRSGNVIYELYENGNVVNRTTNEKYCIVPDRSDYPIYDVIAIKFAWLKYGQKTVESVANRTEIRTIGAGTDRTDTYRNRGLYGNVATYAEFVHYMESSGWARAQITLDENNTNLVSLHQLRKGDSGTAISIRCPAGRSITIMGTNQMPTRENVDTMSAYHTALKFSDDNDVEMSGETLVTIDKMRSSERVTLLARGPYSQFSLTRQVGNDTCGIRAYKTDNEWYMWRSGIQLSGEDIMRINIVNSPIDIQRVNTRIFADMDLWVR